MKRFRQAWLFASLALMAACTQEQQRASVAAEEGTIVIYMTDDMRFAPQHAAISVGTHVMWINDGGLPHTSTDAPGQARVEEHNVLPRDAAPWNSGELEPGERFVQGFTVKGNYTYVCLLHEGVGMIGTLTVQ